jgi:predicted Rossmann fold nucleotide-binding protein DprA/Smf involved in DNA uptake
MTGKARLRDLAEVLRDEMVEHERVAEALRTGPKTIPQIAEALGAPPREVVHWVMAMRRYGMVRDFPKGRADDYYPYALVEAGR